jgi:hypothetical protein
MTAEIIPMRNAREWQYFDKRLTELRVNDVANIIERGRVLMEAKDELPHGSFEMTVKRHFSMDQAQQLMKITRHPILSNADHGRHLPPSWRTLYELTKLPDAVLLAKLKDGTINRKTERKDVIDILTALKAAEHAQQLTGTAARIFEAVKHSETGNLITDELKVLLPDLHPQTVNSTTNHLVKVGILRDSGVRRQGRAEGGRPAIAYEISTSPARPKAKATKLAKSALLTGAEQNEAIAEAKTALVAALKGKTNYQIANIILDVLEACGMGTSLVSRLEDKRDLERGKITKLRIFGPMPDEFEPKRDNGDSK